jgi:hypothetical protein
MQPALSRFEPESKAEADAEADAKVVDRHPVGSKYYFS